MVAKMVAKMVVKFTNFLHLQSLQLTFPRSTMYTPGDRQDQGIRKIPKKRKLTNKYFQGGEKVIDYIVTFEGMGGGGSMSKKSHAYCQSEHF